jgi:HAD superfamily hydrolase (TIGR01509 family)
MAERAVVERHGVAWAPELKRRMLGVSASQSGRLLAEWVGAPPAAGSIFADDLLDAYEVALLAHGVAPMPGAARLIEDLAGRLPLGVASNTAERLVRVALEMSGLPDVFAIVSCAGPAVRPKPAPDIYLRACEGLGVPPLAALAFEDSSPGVASARAAGLRVVGVPSVPGIPLDADLVLGSLRDLDRVALFGSSGA